ncbi:unnamed protein product [Parajaminaea phylloscopi]
MKLSLALVATAALASTSMALGGGANLQGGLVGDLTKELTSPDQLTQALGQRAPQAAGSQDIVNLSQEAIAYAQSLYPGLKDYTGSLDGKGAKPAALAPKAVRREQQPTNISGDDNNSGMCSVGSVSCCNQQITNADSKKQLAGLAGIQDLVGTIGLSCQQLPIGILPIDVSNYCKSTPLCCNKVSQNGLINFGCIALPIN